MLSQGTRAACGWTDRWTVSVGWLSQKFTFLRKRYKHLQMFFQVHGIEGCFLARFIMGARFMAGPMAGAAGMRFWSFLGWNVLGALIWCSLIDFTIG